MSSWKGATMAKCVYRHGNVPHLFQDPVSICYGELSSPQPHSTSIYSLLYRRGSLLYPQFSVT